MQPPRDRHLSPLDDSEDSSDQAVLLGFPGFLHLSARKVECPGAGRLWSRTWAGPYAVQDNYFWNGAVDVEGLPRSTIGDVI